MSLSVRFPPRVFEDSDDIGSNPTDATSIGELIDTRLSRRSLMASLAAASASVLVEHALGRRALAEDPQSSLSFDEVPHGIADNHAVAKGYSAQVLIRWGDPIMPGAPAFDVNNQSAAAQSMQFGYNCDFVGFLPLPPGSNGSDRGLLCVNHEYTSAELMWPGLDPKKLVESLSQEQADVEMAAHGMSIVEITRSDGQWRVVSDGDLNRRITFLETGIGIAGPASGHDRMKTKADPTGTEVIGMVSNCAGGTTPWGTVLTAEENFHNYFSGDPSGLPEAAAYKRYDLAGKPEYAHGRFHDRLNVEKEPNEPNRFGWMVEVDPYDPASKPLKRTALGRMKHEGASAIVNKDGRLAVYMGDDERFEYVYRFISAGTFNPGDRAANLGLLDEGTLSVARFDEDGTLTWLPLVYGQGPLTPANGFNSQADVVIETRRAADLLGATPMDRPEDVDVNPVNGRIYAIMTHNNQRTIDRIDAANPRSDNTAGHIIEIVPPGGEGPAADHAADRYEWNFFLIAGNPVWGGTQYGKGMGKSGWLACPDNCAFDSKGRIWIATDQGSAQPKFDIGDGLYGADTAGDARAGTRKFFAAPRGAELCGPCFTPDDTSLFLAIQHPAEDSTFERPSTRWPDFSDTMPPRPSIVVITKNGGGPIG